MCIVLYIYRSAMRCGKFGVPVCKASMLNWRRCGRGQCDIGIHALLYIYIYAIIYDIYVIIVFKAYMLDCRGQSAMGRCAIVLCM